MAVAFRVSIVVALFHVDSLRAASAKSPAEVRLAKLKPRADRPCAFLNHRNSRGRSVKEWGFVEYAPRQQFQVTSLMARYVCAA